jgi:hypothetical protein
MMDYWGKTIFQHAKKSVCAITIGRSSKMVFCNSLTFFKKKNFPDMKPMKEGFDPGRVGIITFQDIWPFGSGTLESLEETAVAISLLPTVTFSGVPVP